MTRSLVWIQSARGDGHEEAAADAREPRTGSVEAEHAHPADPQRYHISAITHSPCNFQGHLTLTSSSRVVIKGTTLDRCTLPCLSGFTDKSLSALNEYMMLPINPSQITDTM
jgi:hypothetical protein